MKPRQTSSVPQLPLPSLLTCWITAKNGEPYTRAHEKVSPKEFVLTIAEGPAALRKIIEKKLEEMVPGRWQPGFAVFLKPSNHAKQKDYVPLVESSAFKAQLEGVWHAARRRKMVKPGLFLSSSYTSPKSRERQALRFKSGIAGVPATQNYMAVAQARLPEGSDIEIPQNTTFRQLLHIDEQERSMNEEIASAQLQDDAAYRIIRVQIHGIPVPLKVNIADLRDALGLPPYSLCPPFRGPIEVDTPDPAQNVADTDHMEQNEMERSH
ncbi:hypothetical protein F441_10897 [Phytophthora nicotianae CJ01A1]|uniref:Uncharacterized protein n=1 Tax=Phytophthora nicotianae CJ01A1 TaxID=1317063 RepID=W2WUW4_PHYNI|nr:hypothetical protein F441_10897 [Phytophthora nicotianae CJ01A1]